MSDLNKIDYKALDGRKYARILPMALAATLFSLPSGIAMADTNGITRFAVRNCTPAKMLVCAYDKTDSILAIPYHAKRVAPKEKERFSCGSAKRCKVFMGMDVGGIKKVLSSSTNQAIVGTTAGAAGSVALTVGSGGTATMMLIAASNVGLAGAIGISVGTGVIAAGVAVGAAMAVVKTIDGVEAGKMCKKMMKEQKKVINAIDDPDLRASAKDSLKEKINGRWPKYKNHSMIMKGGIMKLVEGDKC